MARYTKVLKSLAHNAVGARRIEAASTGTVLPSQTGQAGKFLKTDGSNLSWATSSSANNFVDSVSVNIGTGIITLGRDGLSDLNSLTLSPLTTKGDLWVFGSANTRLPVGTNSYALVADSSTATGLNWAPNSDANYYTSSAAINSNIITGTVAGGGSNWSVDISGLTSVGTIATGVWSGTSIVDGKIASASNWNDAYNNYVASAAYSAGTLTFTQRDGGTFTATGFSQATGTVTGGGADNRIAHWTSATNVTGTSDLTYDGSKLILGSQGKVIVKYNDEDPKESTEILHVVTSGTEASFAIEALDNSTGVKNQALISTLNADIENKGQYWNTSGSPSYSDIYEWGYNGDASSANRNLYFKTVLAYPILFSTSNTERMRITSAGKVGIGTPAPAQTLDVRGTTLLSGATDTVPFEVFAYGAGTSALHVTSGSNTGLGTATPLAKLHINASAYQQVFQRDTHYMTIVKGNSDDRLIFATGAPNSHTTRFTINNTGIDVVNDAMITGSLTTTGVATLGNNSVTNTQTAGNNSTRIATTAFVTAAVAANTGTPGGSNTQVQFNNGGSFGGDADMTFDGTNLTLANNLYASQVGGQGDTNNLIDFSTADTQDFNIDSKSFMKFTEVGTSGDTIVFNEGSNNIDFRIESDDNPNMFVMDAGGNTIGIGTAAPASNTLHIAGHGNPLRLQGTSSGKVEFGVSTSGDFTIDADDDIRLDAGGQDIALKGAGTEYGRLTNSSSDFVINNSVQDKDLIFKGDDGGSIIEAMRIDYSEGGLVGIGTTTPGKDLDVNGQFRCLSTGTIGHGGTNRTIFAHNNEVNFYSDDTTTPAQVHYQYRGGAFNVARSALHVEAYTANSSNPRVGIGTSSPSVKLDVVGAIKNSSYIHQDADSSSTGVIVGAGGDANFSYDGTDARLESRRVGSGHLLINTGGGKVSIGAASPTEALHVYSGDTGNQLGLYSDANEVSALNFYENTTKSAELLFDPAANDVKLINRISGGDMIFRVENNTEAMRILNTGDVAIGHTSPSYRLDVRDSSYNVALVSGAGNGNYPILHVIDSADQWPAWFEGNRSGDPGTGIRLWHNPSSPNENNNTYVHFAMNNDGGTRKTYVNLKGGIDDYTAGTEDGKLTVRLLKDGTETEMAKFNNTGLSITGNLMFPDSNNTISAFSSDNLYLRAHNDMYFNIDTPNDSTARHFIFRTNTSTEIMRLGEDKIAEFKGDVGIGTAGPNQKLDVAGNINIQDGHNLRWNNATQINILGSSTTGLTYTASKQHFLTYNGVNAYTELMTLDDTGVGIGTTTPNVELHVNGDGRFEENHKLYFSDSATNVFIRGASSDLELRSGDDIQLQADDDIRYNAHLHQFLSGSTEIASIIDTGLTVTGTISATAKSFNIPHPLYKDKRLVHGSLEGPEHGIYIRGTIETEEKGCLVELPEYWSAMCEDYTVQLTPHGPYTVYIKEKLKDKVMIECSQKKFKFDYYIVGARTDETLEVVKDA